MPVTRHTRRRWSVGLTVVAVALLAALPALPAEAAPVGFTDGPSAPASLQLGSTTLAVSGSCAAASWDPLAGQAVTTGVIGLNYQVVDPALAPIGGIASVQIPIPAASTDWSTTLSIDYGSLGTPAAGDYLQLWFDCHDPDNGGLNIVSSSTNVAFVGGPQPPAPHIGTAPDPTVPTGIPFDGTTASAEVSGVCTDTADASFSLTGGDVVVYAGLVDAGHIVIGQPTGTAVTLSGSPAWTATVPFPAATAAGEFVGFMYSCQGSIGGGTVTLSSGTVLVPVTAPASSGSSRDPSDPTATSTHGGAALAETGLGAAGSLVLSVVALLLLGAGIGLRVIGRRRAA